MTRDAKGRFLANGGHTTARGYRRITSGPHRHEYEHRRKINALLEEKPHFIFGSQLPESMHVHHQDFRKWHNCYPNLLVIENVIHDYITQSRTHRHPWTGKFLSQYEWQRLQEQIT